MEDKERLIDAKPIMKFIVDGLNNTDKLKAFGHDAIEILTEIEYAPTVDAVEVVHGRWKRARYTEAPLYICSNCDIPEYKRHNYCPNCGAKMDGGE